MKGFWIRGGVLCALLALGFYSLRAQTELPDLALQSVTLLKKSVEELLPDLQKPEDPETVEAIQAATLDLEPYRELVGQRERWNEMRALIESGQPLFAPLPSEVVVSTSPRGRLAPAIPPEPGLNVQLPYESRLTVSGRKTIGMIYRSSNFSNSNFATNQGLPTSRSNFELLQTLQVRINGTIGRKVTVNVDFDDTKEDKKDISIVYKGDPDELVQRAAFGDITLSLPQTEFAGYSKQVFGASAELKYKALRGYFIGSRTKGETETKEFTGGVILQRLNIPDTSYVRRKFYNFTLLNGGSNDKPIDITTLKVYLDTRDVTRSLASLVPLTVDQTLIPNKPSGNFDTYSGSFTVLAQGVDYTVDASSGLIVMRVPLAPNAVLAVDYQLPRTSGDANKLSNARGTPGQVKGIKWNESEVALIPATEELTHYSIGVTKIVRDNNQGNFIMQLRDLSNNPIGAKTGIQYLPNNSGQIVVDFEQGLFSLTRRLDATNGDFSQVYNFSPTTRSSFFIEFRSRLKTYTLRPGIVIGSEQISLNGRRLTRDVDYLIDYESGFLQFFNEDQITEDSKIRATYDFSPFGIAGAQQDTLVGTRAELSLYPLHPILGQSLIGTSVIYDFAPKQTSAPDIRQTSGSFLVTEADALFKDLIFKPFPFLKSSFGVEGARSTRNPNTFGKALIDNMEGIKEETSVPMSKLAWQIASNPTPGVVAYAESIGIVHSADEVGDNLTNSRIRTKDINPNASALDGDQTLVLNIRYDLAQSAEASIATVLSRSGIDFTKKQYVEMWIQGDATAGSAGGASGTEMNVTLGQIDEDSDNTNGGGFVDTRAAHPLGDNTPRTEDLNYNGTLDIDEDIGWTYRNPNGTTRQIGERNLVIDSQDFDRSGTLDAGNAAVGGNLGFAPGAINSLGFNCSAADCGGGTPSSGANAVDHTGWKFVRVPLNISSSTIDAQRWSAIKHLRLTLRPGAGPKTGIIRIAKINIVGTRWQANPSAIAGSTVTVKAVNNEDDRSYVSPAGGDFDELNQVNTALTGPTPTRRREQALSLQYVFSNVPNIQGSSVSARVELLANAAMDFTQYGSIRMYVYGDGSNNTFFYRVGTDTDFLEFSLPVTWRGWANIIINQVGGGASQRPTTWAADARNPAPGAIRSGGNPNLSYVARQTVGVVNNSPSGSSGEIWVNEIYASDVISRVGHAAKITSDFEIFGWGTFGFNVRDIDRNFETFTSAVANQDRHESNAYLTVSRLTWLPMRFTNLKRRTLTPAINTVTGGSLVSVQQEGRVDQNTFSGAATLQLPRIPTMGFTYDSDDVKTANLFRQDKTRKYGTTLDYAVPSTNPFLPRNISLGYRLTKLNLDFGSEALLNTSDPFSVSDTRNATQDMTAKMAFQPLTGFTFNPNYSLTTTREEKDVIFSTAVAASTTTLKYDKAKSQTLGFDGVLAFRRWFAPRLRYSLTDRETYGIPLTNNPDAALFKTVDRTGTSEAAWDFAWRDFSRKARALQTLNVVTSYSVEDGDSWDRVESGYNSLKTFSVRQALGSGTRRNLTIRDTLRSTQRWNPFEWTLWSGALQPLRTLSLTSTLVDTRQRQETTGTQTRINTRIFPDFIFSMSQTEYLFGAQRFMSNSQMNIKTQFKKVDTVNVSQQKASTLGGDWRMTLWRKLDLFTTYTRTADRTEDLVNNVTSSKSNGEVLGLQTGFNVGRWRISPKYDQTKQQTRDSSGRLTTDLTTRIPAVQLYADLYLPAGLRLPFGDLVVFSNRIRTTNTLSLTQRRSSLNDLANNTDTYQMTTSNDYEMTTNIRLTLGGSYSYQVNKASSQANIYTYEINSLLTIQF